MQLEDSSAAAAATHTASQPHDAHHRAQLPRPPPVPEGRELSGYEVEQAFSVLSSIDVGALSVGAGGSHAGVTIPVTAPHTVSPAGTLEAAATAFASVASGRTGEPGTCIRCFAATGRLRPVLACLPQLRPAWFSCHACQHHHLTNCRSSLLLLVQRAAVRPPTASEVSRSTRDAAAPTHPAAPAAWAPSPPAPQPAQWCAAAAAAARRIMAMHQRPPPACCLRPR